MKRKKLVGLIFISSFFLALIPLSFLPSQAITSYSTGQSGTASVFEDFDHWYESNEPDSLSTPAYMTEEWDERTTSFNAWYLTYNIFRFEIKTENQDSEVLFTRLRFYLETGATANYVNFTDTNNNTLYADETGWSLSAGEGWKTIDFADWCGKAWKVEIEFVDDEKIGSWTSNDYDDELYDTEWVDGFDLMFELEFVDKFGYVETFSAIDEWSGSSISTDGDVLTAQIITSTAWLSGYSYRKSHTLSQITGGTTNMQIMFYVHYGSGTDSGQDMYCNSKCQADFDDIRFTDDDGVTELDYWLEDKSDSDYAIFWVEITDNLGASAQTVYVYFGNSGASSASSAEDTFVYFLDKDNTTGWTTSDLTVSTSGDGNFLRFYNPTAADVGSAERSDISSPADWVTEIRFKGADIAGDDQFGLGLMDGGVANRFSWQLSPPFGDQNDFHYYDGAEKDLYANGYAFGTEFILKVRVDEGDSSFGVDYFVFDTDSTYRTQLASVTSENFAVGSPSDMDSIYIGDASGVAVIDAYVRWLFVRKIANNGVEPAHGAWGDEEYEGFYNDTSVSIATGTYQFLEFVITDTNTTVEINVTVSSTYYTVDSSLGAGTYRYNLEKVVSGTVDGIYIGIETTGEGDYTKFDYIRIFRFFEWISSATDGDKTEYAYRDSGDLIAHVDSGKHLNLSDSIDAFTTDDFPYCRIEISTGVIGLILLDSGDAELETKNFTVEAPTQQFSYGLSVAKVRLQIYNSMTIDFITFSVQNVSVTVTSDYADDYLSTSQSISISDYDAKWGDDTAINDENIWINIIENSTVIHFNKTSNDLPLSRSVQLYKATYYFGVQTCNDSRYRYWVLGTNDTFWIDGTSVTIDFDFDVEYTDAGNFLIEFTQISQACWLNGSVVDNSPNYYWTSDSTDKGQGTLESTGWFAFFKFFISESSGEHIFNLNITSGSFTEICYTETFDPADYTESHLVFSFFSNIDGLGIQNDLLKIYVDGTRVYHMETWQTGSSINLTLTDYFGNEAEWEVDGMVYPDYDFTSADLVFIDIGLPLIKLEFYNPGEYELKVVLSKGDNDWIFFVGPQMTYDEFRVVASDYTYVTYYVTREGDETVEYEWEIEPRAITVTSESYNFHLTGKDRPYEGDGYGKTTAEFDWTPLLLLVLGMGGGFSSVVIFAHTRVIKQIKMGQEPTPKIEVPLTTREKYRENKRKRREEKAERRNQRKSYY